MDKRIFALGFFDGVHLGHQALLAECCRMAEELHAVPAALTFDRHPKSLVCDTPPILLSTEEDRQKLLEHYGIREIFTLEVIPENMGMPWQVFMDRLLEKNAVGFVCGDDFRCGFKGLGNAESIQGYCRERNLPCTVIPEQSLNGKRISSTLIRRCMESGDLKAANAYLGHPYLLTAICKNGRLQLPTGVALPKPGAYDCRATVNGHLHSAIVRLTPERASLQLPDIDSQEQSVILEFHSPLDEEC